MKICIKKITQLPIISKILDLMKAVWDLSDAETVALFEMKAVSSFGILFAAFDVDVDESRPVGFIYGFPKFPASHYSHQMGIDKSYQNKNVGFLLKKEHRKVALNSTKPVIESIDWTVDPLLGPNASLNFRKLGVVCNTYYPNYYGDSQGAVDIYPAVPTDRLLVKWRINLERVIQRFDHDNPLIPPWQSVRELQEKITPLTTLKQEHGFLEIPDPSITTEILKQQPKTCSLEVPDQYTKLSKQNIVWATQWRLSFRNICLSLFGNGYYLVDFLSFKEKNNYKNRRNVFIFVRNVNEYPY